MIRIRTIVEGTGLQTDRPDSDAISRRCDGARNSGIFVVYTLRLNGMVYQSNDV